MLETIAIKTVWGKALGAIKRVPVFVWIGLAVLALWWIDRGAQYREGRADGREQVMAEFRAAEKDAAERAAKALANADKKAADRAKAQSKIIADQIERIEQAEANNENPLDSLF